MDKQEKQMIKQLKKDGKYHEIFVNFGQKAYNKNTPRKYQKEELKLLVKNGRYEDIYNKYGESVHNKYMVKSMYHEIKEAKGTLNAVLWRAGIDVSRVLKKIGIDTMITLSAVSSVLAIETQQMVKENATQYESEIESYHENITEYAKEVKEQELNDIQVFMKVMDDMWKSIKGYDVPKKDIMGFLELDLATEDGYGVCRNMASDVAKKLDAINPEYNARTMLVTMKEGHLQLADIERKIIHSNETVMDTEEKEKSFINSEDIFGNHMVTLVDIKSDNLTLVLDPTNPAIGIYNDGKIMMLNTSRENGIEYVAKEFAQASISEGSGIKGIQDVFWGYIKSLRQSKLNLDEINDKYGLEAQNKALFEVRELSEKNSKTIQREESFRESMKVNLEDRRDSEMNVQEENTPKQDKGQKTEREF